MSLIEIKMEESLEPNDNFYLRKEISLEGGKHGTNLFLSSFNRYFFCFWNGPYSTPTKFYEGGLTLPLDTGKFRLEDLGRKVY